MEEQKTKKRIFIENFCRKLAIVILEKYHPQIIGITGSVGKTSTKEAVFTVLKDRFRTRMNEKNYNNEVGIPLTIIGADSPGGSVFGWLGVLLKWFYLRFFPNEYPEILILEMGADRPGDITYLTDFIKSKIGIITDISGSHLEYFKTIEGVAKEKGQLVRRLSKDGLAVLNTDNAYVKKLEGQLESRVVTFGFDEGAGMRATDISIGYTENTQGMKEVRGLSFKLNYKGTSLPVRLNNILARHQIYSALAAAAVGTELGMNLVEVSEALENFVSPPGRMNLFPGIKNSFIIDDTYNASPVSTIAALDVLGQIEVSGRKIAVLGDMLELGNDNESGHRDVGKKFFEMRGDVFFAVGKRMKWAVDELIRRKFPPENILVFENSLEARKKVQEIIQSGDLLLVKGSQGKRMEKIVEEIMAEPEKAEKLLCRQSEDWKNTPVGLGV